MSFFFFLRYDHWELKECSFEFLLDEVLYLFDLMLFVHMNNFVVYLAGPSTPAAENSGGPSEKVF